MQPSKQALLDTTPRWLSLTLTTSSAALAITGLGFLLNLTTSITITPFTLLLHLVWALTIAAWALNLRTRIRPERRALLAVGVAISVGSAWSSIQQWLVYIQNGTSNDILLVVGAMVMDTIGGLTTYILYHLNILRK